MSWNNKVIWSKGLFVRPQHFQQQDRYIETFVEGRTSPLRSFPWGFEELQLDHQLLSIGKVSIAKAKGVFPDGTPFDIPNDTQAPPPLEVTAEVRNMIVVLGVALRRQGGLDVQNDADRDLGRYVPLDYEAPDSTMRSGVSALLQVGRLNMRLLLTENEPVANGEPRKGLQDVAYVGIAHVTEAKANLKVVLDESYIPPVLACGASPTLTGFLNELQGLLHHRGIALAGRVSGAGRGVAEIADFLWLQAINRYEPMVAHLARLSSLHPEALFRFLLGMAGELSTFTTADKRPPEFPEYRHHDLRATFADVIKALRVSLSMVLEQTAIPLPLVEKRYGIRVAAINDRSLLDTANFVLAVKADIPTEEIRRGFGRQAKMAAVEEIRTLVNGHLPGIAITPSPVAPRQIPYHAGYVYFELDQTGEHWTRLKASGGFALHVAGEFPGLELEFWAIRS